MFSSHPESQGNKVNFSKLSENWEHLIKVQENSRKLRGTQIILGEPGKSGEKENSSSWDIKCKLLANINFQSVAGSQL